MKRILLLAFLFLLGCLYSNAQTSVQIDPQVAAEHLLNHPKPLYPAIARAAHIEGTVVLFAGIDPNGRVTDAKVISGPPMLREAAIEEARQFTFSPFQQDGNSVPVTTFLGIQFAMGGQSPSYPGFVSVVKNLKVDDGMRAISDFLASYSACNRQIQQQTASSEAIKLCQDAVRKAEALSSNASARRSAYVAYATALLQNGKTAEAVQAGNSAITAANSTSNDFAGASSAYAVTAEALALTNNLQEANVDFSIAEKYVHKVIGSMPAHSPRKEQLTQTLKSILEYHAKILEKMDKHDEAQKKLNEAAKL